VGVILSGGNMDLDQLTTLTTRVCDINVRAREDQDARLCSQ
jgi:hypothetical protein